MADLLSLGATFPGASAAVFVIFIVLGLAIFFVAPILWREDTAYWEDVSSILLLSAATAFLFMLVSFALQAFGGISLVPADRLTLALVICLGSIGLYLANNFLEQSLTLVDSQKQLLLIWSALMLGIATVFAVGSLCAVLCKLP